MTTETTLRFDDAGTGPPIVLLHGLSVQSFHVARANQFFLAATDSARSRPTSAVRPDPKHRDEITTMEDMARDVAL